MKDNVRWPQVILATVVSVLAAWFFAGWTGLLAFALAGVVLWLGARLHPAPHPRPDGRQLWCAV